MVSSSTLTVVINGYRAELFSTAVTTTIRTSQPVTSPVTSPTTSTMLTTMAGHIHFGIFSIVVYLYWQIK